MIGFAICGSFCNFKYVLSLLEETVKKYGEVLPIMSETAYNTDTRFFKAEDFINKVTYITEKTPFHSITECEPIGPKKMLELLIVCPCTGNTISKLAHGITDTAVTMAVKSHSRSGGKTIFAVSSNDALSGSFEAIAKVKNRNNMFFVPMYQDDTSNKPNSLTFIKPLLLPAVDEALKGQQIEPIFNNVL